MKREYQCPTIQVEQMYTASFVAFSTPLSGDSADEEARSRKIDWSRFDECDEYDE